MGRPTRVLDTETVLSLQPLSTRMSGMRQHSAGCLSHPAACDDLTRPFLSPAFRPAVSSRILSALSPALSTVARRGDGHSRMENMASM